MTPSTGVTDTISTTPDSDSAARTPMPTPTSALRIGRPAPTSVPSMTIRTIAAITSPTNSPPPRMDGIPEAISVEKSVATPGIGCVPNASWTALLVSGVTSNWVSVNMTGATAAVPSSETSRIPDDIWSRAAPPSSLLRCASSCALPASSSACLAARPVSACSRVPVAVACARAASSWAWPWSSWADACSSCACPAEICWSWARAGRLGGERVDDLRYAVDVRSCADPCGDRGLLGIREGFAVVRSEDDRAAPAGRRGELRGEALGDLCRRCAGDRQPVRQVPAPDREGDAGECEDRDPGDDHDSAASAREPADPIEKFCHVVAPVRC